MLIYTLLPFTHKCRNMFKLKLSFSFSLVQTPQTNVRKMRISFTVWLDVLVPSYMVRYGAITAINLKTSLMDVTWTFQRNQLLLSSARYISNMSYSGPGGVNTISRADSLHRILPRTILMYAVTSTYVWQLYMAILKQFT
jgi:hypothetical protein